MTAENEGDKLLLAAKRIRRATGTDFVISLVADDFSWACSTYVGKLRQACLLVDLLRLFIQLPPVDVLKLSYDNILQVQLFWLKIHHV